MEILLAIGGQASIVPIALKEGGEEVEEEDEVEDLIILNSKIPNI